MFGLTTTRKRKNKQSRGRHVWRVEPLDDRLLLSDLSLVLGGGATLGQAVDPIEIEFQFPDANFGDSLFASQDAHLDEFSMDPYTFAWSSVYVQAGVKMGRMRAVVDTESGVGDPTSTSEANSTGFLSWADEFTLHSNTAQNATGKLKVRLESFFVQGGKIVPSQNVSTHIFASSILDPPGSLSVVHSADDGATLPESLRLQGEEVSIPIGIPFHVTGTMTWVVEASAEYPNQLLSESSMEALHSSIFAFEILTPNVTYSTESGTIYPNSPFPFDYGDAPDPTYATLLANDGARHVVGSTLFLGAGVDPEADGQPNATASGDDVAGPTPFPGDEDGLIGSSAFVIGEGANIQVLASGPGFIDAWMDLNGNGAFDHPTEHIGGGVSIPVVAGSNTLNFAIPASAVAGPTFARLRISSDGGLLPTGLAVDGEVEDYAVTISPPSPDEIGVRRGIQYYRDSNGNGTWELGSDLFSRFGIPSDELIIGDWDGNGTDDIGVRRDNRIYRDGNGNGTWEPGTDLFSRFGSPSDVMIVGNWSSPLLASGGAADGSNAGPPLSRDDLTPIVSAASDLLAGTGLTSSQIDRLHAVTVSVSDLSGARLGQALGSTITIDINAADYGWFIDSTPYDYEEFAIGSEGLFAAGDSAASGRMDLLTVVLHELGHVLGLPDDHSGGVMDGMLSQGVRRIPTLSEFA